MRSLPPVPSFPTLAARLWFWLMAFNAVSVPLLGFGSVLAALWFLVLEPVAFWSLPSCCRVLGVFGAIAVAWLWTVVGTRLSMLALERLAAAHRGLPCLPPP